MWWLPIHNVHHGSYRAYRAGIERLSVLVETLAGDVCERQSAREPSRCRGPSEAFKIAFQVSYMCQYTYIFVDVYMYASYIHIDVCVFTHSSGWFPI